MASPISETASFSHSSDDWWVTVNSSSSRCSQSAGPFCRASSSSVRMYRS